MKRRGLIGRTVLAAISAGVYTATGWLMGAGALTMQIPCPPSPVSVGCTGLYTPCTQVTCGGACTKTCVYCCSGGFWQIWYGCTNENPPCSAGFCGYEDASGSCPV